MRLLFIGDIVGEAGRRMVVRFTPELTVRQTYACEIAQRIGGGCRLTTVAAAPAAAQ